VEYDRDIEDILSTIQAVKEGELEAEDAKTLISREEKKLRE